MRVAWMLVFGLSLLVAWSLLRHQQSVSHAQDAVTLPPPQQAILPQDLDRLVELRIEAADPGAFPTTAVLRWLDEGKFEIAVHALETATMCEHWLERFGYSKAMVREHEGFLQYVTAYHPECVPAFTTGVSRWQSIEAECESIGACDPELEVAALCAIFHDTARSLLVRNQARGRLLNALPDTALQAFLDEYFLGLSNSTVPWESIVQQSLLKHLFGLREERPWILAYLGAKVQAAHRCWQQIVLSTGPVAGDSDMNAWLIALQATTPPDISEAISEHIASCASYRSRCSHD